MCPGQELQNHISTKKYISDKNVGDQITESELLDKCINLNRLSESL